MKSKINNYIQDHYYFLRQAIEENKSRINKITSPKINRQANKILTNLEKNLENVTTYNSILQKFSSPLTKKIVGWALSFFIDTTPLLKDDKALEIYNNQFQSKLTNLIFNELSKSAESHLHTCAEKNSSRGKQNTLATILIDQGLINKLAAEIEKMSPFLDRIEKIKLIKKLIHTSLKKKLPINSSVRFHVDQLVAEYVLRSLSTEEFKNLRINFFEALLPIKNIKFLINSNLLTTTLLEDMSYDYLERVRDQEKLSLLQINHVLLFLEWFKLQEQAKHSQQIIQQVEKRIEDRINQLDLKKQIQSEKITEDELDLIHFSGVMNYKNINNDLSPRLQQLTADYVALVITNPKTLKKFNHHADNEQIIEFEIKESMNTLKSMIYKSRYLRELKNKNLLKNNRSIIEKANQLLENYKKGNIIDPKTKLSIPELGILEDLTKLNEYLVRLSFSKYAESNSDITNILSLCHDAADVYNQIEGLSREQASKIYPSGTIALTNPDLQVSMRRFESNREEKMTRIFVSRFSHAAKIYISKDKVASISHVYGYYENEPLSLRDMVINEYFYISPRNLIHSDLLSKLEKMGEEGRLLLEDFEKKYAEIERHIHEDLRGNFKRLENSQDARYSAGYAKYGLIRKMEGTSTSQRIMKLREQIITPNTFGEGSTMICSEFTALSSTTAYSLLDDWLCQQLKDRGIEIPNPGNDLIALRLPIESNRRYETINPEEIITLASRKNIVSKLPKTDIIAAIIGP